jgi:hypothetical protein
MEVHCSFLCPHKLTSNFRRIHVGRKKRLLASSFLSVCLCVCLSACISAVPTVRIFVKFSIGDFYENLSKKSRLG